MAIKTLTLGPLEDIDGAFSQNDPGDYSVEASGEGTQEAYVEFDDVTGVASASLFNIGIDGWANDAAQIRVELQTAAGNVDIEVITSSFTPDSYTVNFVSTFGRTLTQAEVNGMTLHFFLENASPGDTGWMTLNNPNITYVPSFLPTQASAFMGFF